MRAVELVLPAGAVLGALGVLLAARRRRRATGLPREVERLLEAVPGQLGDAVLVLDAGGRIARVNAAALVLTASTPPDLLGRPLAALGPDLPVLAKGLSRGPVAALVSILARGGPRRARAALLRVGGHLDVVVIRPEPAARPPPLPRRAAPAAERPTPESGLAAAAAVREPLGRVARAASLLRLCAPPLGARADAALAAIEEALDDAEHRLVALASAVRPGVRRPLDLAALVDDVLRTLQAPGFRHRADLSPARAHGDDRALRVALRELLRALAAALPVGEEILVTVRAVPEPTLEIAVGAAAPRGVGAIARALLAAHVVHVEEDAASGHGWRLRVGLSPVPADARSGSAFV